MGQVEFTDYIAPDGKVYPFNAFSPQYGRWVIGIAGQGTPPIEYITQRGPFQDGETVRDFFLRPRVIQMQVRNAYCNRDSWWAGRAAMLNGIRPNRQTTPTGTTPGNLRVVESDGTIRQLDVFIAEGPRFEPAQLDKWDEWAFQEVLRFIAYDPLFYDPNLVTVTFLPVSCALGFPYIFTFSFSCVNGLIFPITFPIVFNSSYLSTTQTITYTGTWLTYPVITLTGPMTNPTMTNTATGEKLTLNYTISAGEVVTIDLRYGRKTVSNQTGTNLIGYLSNDSNLATFHIAPDPEAPGGLNPISLVAYLTTVGATQMTFSYYTKFFGI